MTATLGIVTISDRASQGVYEDRSGPAIREWLKLAVTTPWREVYRVVPDEQAAIESTLIELCDQLHCCLIVTTGGTGPAPRDITPEITERVCQKLLPGFGELMRSVSLRSVATAILSRQTAGTRGQTLILNLPGKPAAIAECLRAVFPAIPYCLDLIGAAYLEADPEFIPVFRPKP
jgi:molybdopterin adenylyltransferase